MLLILFVIIYVFIVLYYLFNLMFSIVSNPLNDNSMSLLLDPVTLTQLKTNNKKKSWFIFFTKVLVWMISEDSLKNSVWTDIGEDDTSFYHIICSEALHRS